MSLVEAAPEALEDPTMRPPCGRPTALRNPPRRSKTRQGKVRLLTLDHLDQRSAAYAYACNLIATLSSDLGGDAAMSEGERQLVTRAAMVGAIVADFEGRWVAGQQVQLSDYLAAVNVQRRVLATLGLERRQRTIGPTLSDYLTRPSPP